MYTGYIDTIHKNYGVVKSKVDGHIVKFLFYIFPDMLDDGKFKIAKEVTFKLTTTQIRGVRLKLAYDLKSATGKKIKSFKVESEELRLIEDYHDFIYRKFYKIHDELILRQLIEKDNQFKEMVLKWILFLEQTTKDLIVIISIEQGVNRLEIYDELSKNRLTKKIHQNIMVKLKRNYSFRNEFELLTIERNNSGDISTFEVKDCPLALYLENTTLDELGKILEVISEKIFISSSKSDERLIFLNQTKEMFLELSLIRNACAHGNPFVPLILDDNYSPSYLYDLSSVDPEFNSGDNVENWKLFEPLRWTIRQLTKCGIAPFYRGGLQYTGLYTTKYILINPARRSFFSFIYIIEFYFRYVEKAKESDFRQDFRELIPFFEENDNSLEKNIFSKYPKDTPVYTQILRFIYPLYCEDAFWILAHKL
ncbi:Abi family protein [Enterococcus faecalis]